MEFTDEQIEAVQREFDGHLAGLDCLCEPSVAARLILQARAERDWEIERTNELSIWLDRAERARNRFQHERAAALARVRELEDTHTANLINLAHEAGRDIAALETKNMKLQQTIAALEERINHLKCQLECNWCEGAGRKDGKPCDICEAGKSIAALEAENAELRRYDLRRAAVPFVPAERIAENERLRGAFEKCEGVWLQEGKRLGMRMTRDFIRKLLADLRAAMEDRE